MEAGIKTQKSQPTNIKQSAPSKTATHDFAPPAADPGSKVAIALAIVAEESGLALSDLTDNAVFSDIGIDSLLGLTITARFKEDLDLDLDFDSLFSEYPTVGDLKTLIGGSSATISTGASTPRTTSSNLTGTTTPDIEPLGHKEFDFNRVLDIISDESGVATKDLTNDTNFAEAGVDSLLSLVIVSRFRDELELDIQHESLFLECPTVADLKLLLLGEPVVESNSVPQKVKVGPEPNDPLPLTETAITSLQARKRAVDDLVAKYTAGFTVAAPSITGHAPNDMEKVVLVTGASGSLGGNLVYHLAALPDVKWVICLNRENKEDPYIRQQKAMRAKGLRFPEALKPKLKVFQSDTAKSKLGLPNGEYEALLGSVTHLIHNAWPMSAKRPLAGFESQFQVMRNLINVASEISSRHPKTFKFSFQMVSSIGVVGHYNLDSTSKVVVPEERTTIASVLPNGYGEAKWGCERMLDETLHKHPERFRTMAVRLGQIAGSKISGYWNPMEHFGFLIKSSQTLNALPDLKGGLFWTSVNDIAGALSDLVLSSQTPYPIYHIENPVGQPWREMTPILADALKIPLQNIIPFEKWLERVRNAPQRNNPASTLLDFLDDNFLRMSCGGLVLDTKKSLEHSKTLAAVGPISEEVARKYIHVWREIGFLV